MPERGTGQGPGRGLEPGVIVEGVNEALLSIAAILTRAPSERSLELR